MALLPPMQQFVDLRATQEAAVGAGRKGVGGASAPLQGDSAAIRSDDARARGGRDYYSPGLFDLIDGPDLHGVAVGPAQDGCDPGECAAAEASGAVAQEHYQLTLDRFRRIVRRADVAAHERDVLLMEVVRVASPAAVSQAYLSA